MLQLFSKSLPAKISPSVRCTFHGLSAASGKFGAIVGTFLFLPIESNGGLAGIMWTQFAFSFVAGVCSALFLPYKPAEDEPGEGLDECLASVILTPRATLSAVAEGILRSPTAKSRRVSLAGFSPVPGDAARATPVAGATPKSAAGDAPLAAIVDVAPTPNDGGDAPKAAAGAGADAAATAAAVSSANAADGIVQPAAADGVAAGAEKSASADDAGSAGRSSSLRPQARPPAQRH